jgi:Kelch motif
MYDPATDTWTDNLAPMPTANAYGRAITIDDYIYLIGGAGPTATFDRYSPATNTWEVGPTMPTARGDASVFAEGDYLYVSGGINDYGWWGGITNVERYFLPDFPTGAWEMLPDAPDAFGAAAYGCAADKMWSIGGQDSSGWAVTTNRYQDESLPCKCGAPVDVPWLAEDPITGTITHDSIFAVDVTFTAFPTMTVGGVYTASLIVNSDDPFNPRIVVHVTMTVVAPVYSLEVSADQVGSGEPGEIVTYTVTITNTSVFPSDSFTATLGASAYDTGLGAGEDPWIIVGPLAPGESAAFVVTVHIPAEALDGDHDTVQITVASIGDPTKTVITNVTTNVYVVIVPPTNYPVYLPLIWKLYP